MPARREMPEDFPAVATLPIRTLAARYGAAQHIVSRWRRELGITVPPGAPRGNGNSIGNRNRRKATHGIDDMEAVRTCLSCTAPRCSGKCSKVH